MDFEVSVPREMGGNYGLFGYFDGFLVLDEFYPVIPVYDDEGWNVEIPPDHGDVTYLDASFYLVRVTAPRELMVIASGVEVSLFLVAGLIMDRLGRKVAIVPCFTIQGVVMLLLPLTSSFASLLAVAAAMGLGNGLGSGVMMTLGADLAPPDSRGEFLGVWRLVGDAGGTGAPLVVGTIADLLTLPAASLVIAGSGLIAAAIFVLFVPETLKPML